MELSVKDEVLASIRAIKNHRAAIMGLRERILKAQAFCKHPRNRIKIEEEDQGILGQSFTFKFRCLDCLKSGRANKSARCSKCLSKMELRQSKTDLVNNAEETLSKCPKCGLEHKEIILL